MHGFIFFFCFENLKTMKQYELNINVFYEIDIPKRKERNILHSAVSSLLMFLIVLSNMHENV